MNVVHDRLSLLRMYLMQLGSDMKQRGEFEAAGENRIEAAALAVLGGSLAMAAQFKADVAVLAGEGKAIARPMLEGIIAREAGRLASRGIGKLAGLFSAPVPKRVPRPGSRAEVGKKFMDTAANLGRRTGR